MHDEVWVIAGGPAPDSRQHPPIPDGAVVIAADSGADHLVAMGRMPTIVVGDLDSVGAATLAAVRAAGVDVREHPRDKDQSDLELALSAAAELEPKRIVVVASDGGRADHHFANLLAIASPRLASVEVTAYFGATVAYAVHDRRTLDVDIGATVSLFAMGGPATGVTTSGLRFPLANATLAPLVAHGLSNVCVANEVSVKIATGVVLALCPDQRDA